MNIEPTYTAVLETEVEHLRARIEELEAERDRHHYNFSVADEARQRAETERDRLRANLNDVREDFVIAHEQRMELLAENASLREEVAAAKSALRLAIDADRSGPAALEDE